MQLIQQPQGWALMGVSGVICGQGAGPDQNLRTLIKLPAHEVDCPYLTQCVYVEYVP